MFRLFLLTFLLGLAQCSGATLGALTGQSSTGGNSIISSGGSSETDSGSSGSSEGDSDSENSFESGAPVDIPVTIAKVIRPVDARTINSLPTSDSIVVQGRAEANARVQFFNNDSALGFVTADGSGNFNTVFTLDEISLEDSLSMVVVDGEDSSTPITVRTYGDNSFTVALTYASTTFVASDYEMLNRAIDYAPNCRGIGYNARHIPSNTYAILCVNLEDATVEPLADNLSEPLDQIQFSSDGSFLVGLNPSNRMVHVNLETNVKTVISDLPVVSEAPSIRLSPDDRYVVTTSDLGESSIRIVLEPMNFTPQTATSDRIVINEAVYNFNNVTSYSEFYAVGCDWMNSHKIQCSLRVPFIYMPEYMIAAYELEDALESNQQSVVVMPFSFTTRDLILNTRVSPVSEGHFIYEGCHDAYMTNGCGTIHELVIGQADPFIMGAYMGPTRAPELTRLENSGWSSDGAYIFYEATFSGGLHPGHPKVFASPDLIYPISYQNLPYNARPIAYAFNPTPADPEHPELLAYVCEDTNLNFQVCVSNVDNLNLH